ncbi:MAG TPA: AgmX/PglI C-terminal domain-containing protein, partial [Polyangiaceae bacterium]|nr:AgmX/PglI C-terminal domain-containing protein [Polyangiaceae bacterium]
MKVAALALAAFALMLTTCGGAPIGGLPCDGPACARGSSVPPFAGFEPASHASVRTAPITLDSVDGKALSLERLDAETVVDGPLAFTELRLTFKNQEERQIEGRFRMALPPRASVSRFAMKIAGRWQEAEVVEKARGTEVYETFLHQKVDPALLEQGAGNELGARVFPIFAKSTVELVLGYSQELSDDDRTVLPLEGLAEVQHLEARIVRASAVLPIQRLMLEKKAPEDDLRVDDLGSDAGLRSGSLVMARVRPKIEAPPEPLRAALFLIDTSASRALDLDRQLSLVRALAMRIASLQAGAPIAIGCFDQRAELAYAGRADGLTREHFERIRRRRALGASDLHRALHWARKTAREGGLSRVVLVSDGVPTAGETSGNALRLAVRRLSEGGIERMDVVAFGGIRDDELLATLADADLARDGIVVDGTAPPSMLWRKLNHATRSEMRVEVEGASWWYPRSLESMQPGDEALVFAEMKGTAPPHIVVDGQPQPAPELRQTEPLLLERALDRAKIASLVERTRRYGNSPELQREIVELSTKARVLSPYTSLLVLEQEWHYQRFGIDRHALADILTIRDGRIAVLERSQQKPQAQGNLSGDSMGSGGLGLTGIGSGGGGSAPPLESIGTIGRGSSQASPQSGTGVGFGSGHGRLGRSHQAQAPRVRMGATSVSGRLPPEIVQRIVRQNFGRFRGAYNAALRRNPQARGRVAMRFVIALDGSVTNVDVASTEINDAQFLEDLRQAFASLTFPVPEGGVVTVTYPI